MLSDSVAQKLTLAVSAGKKKVQNCPALGCLAANCDVCESIGPKPPAFMYAQARSNSPNAISSGALMLSSKPIDSKPRQTTTILSSQNARKQTSCGTLIPSIGNGAADFQEGSHTPSSVYRAMPPIHVWIPNQPQATKARISAGTFAPRIPNAARQ